MPKVRLDEAPVQRGSMLWTWDGCLTTGILSSIPVRMVIAGYKLGSATGLVVISPLEPTAAVIEWIKKTGMDTFVVAPNKQHHFWAAEMKKRLPGALLAAPASLAVTKPKLPIDVKITPLAGVQDLPGSWPADVIDVIPIQGCSALDELAFLHKPSSTLILTDLAFNFSKSDQRLGLLSKLYLSWYGGFQPCCVTSAFKGLFNDPVAVKQSFDEILSRWEFDQVSMAHGAFIPNNGKQTFRDGSYAFVDQLVQQQQGKTGGKVAGNGQAAKMPGIAAGVTAAAALIVTAVGIGVAGIMQTKQP